MRPSARAVTACVLIGVTAVCLSACGLTASRHRSTGVRSAVVLAPDGRRTRLVVVDLDGFTVTRSLPLRSLVTDIDVDKTTGLVVAAQTGGIGERADRAVSIVDPVTGRCDYVALEVPAPTSVVCIDGKAYVLHSVVTPEGLVCSVVDVSKRMLEKTCRAPDGPGLWTQAGGVLWTARLDQHGGWDAVALSRPGLEPSVTVTASEMTVCGVVESHRRTLMLGHEPSNPACNSALLLDSAGSVVATVAIDGLRYPPRVAAETSGALVIGDWAGQVPEPTRLAVLDPATLRQKRSIAVDGVPCALAAYRDRVLVVERKGGRLLEIDPDTGAVVRSVGLGSRDLLLSDIVVVKTAVAR